MKNKILFKMVFAALFAALIFIGTQFIRIPLPFGYFNLGDCFIILSAVLIGGPYAICSSVIGAVLADIISGYGMYAPATFIIKLLMVITILLTAKAFEKKDVKHKRLVMAMGASAAELIMICGYFIYDIILYSFAGALAALPGNIIQGTAAVIISTVTLMVLDKTGITKRIKLK